MYSPLIHLVPVVTQITWVSSTSSLLPFVKTTPARTFRRAYGDEKLFVSSPNLARTREATRSASTCGRWGVPSPGATGCKPVGKNKVQILTSVQSAVFTFCNTSKWSYSSTEKKLCIFFHAAFKPAKHNLKFEAKFRKGRPMTVLKCKNCYLKLYTFHRFMHCCIKFWIRGVR